MRFVKSLLAVALGAVALVPSGCVANESSFFVQHALYLEQSADCSFDTDLPAYTSGVMDIGIRNASYGLAVSVANQLASLGNSDLLRTETSYIRLEGAEIAIEGLSGAPSVPAFTLPLTDTIPPSSGDEPGAAVAFFSLVPSGAIEETGRYLISMRLFGRTLGGTPIEAGEFTWPLEVCDGCLKVCDEEAAPPCTFQVGGDYAHSCLFYGTGGCDDC